MIQIKNKVQLIGKIDNPRISTTNSDMKVAEFHISISNSYYNNEGDKCLEIMKHLCKAYGKLAEIIERYCSKEMEIAIEGFLISSITTFNSKSFPTNCVQVNDLLILSKTT